MNDIRAPVDNNVIVIRFYSPSCLIGTAKGPFGLSVRLLYALLVIKQLFRCPKPVRSTVAIGMKSVPIVQ